MANSRKALAIVAYQHRNLDRSSTSDRLLAAASRESAKYTVVEYNRGFKTCNSTVNLPRTVEGVHPGSCIARVQYATMETKRTCQ